MLAPHSRERTRTMLRFLALFCLSCLIMSPGALPAQVEEPERRASPFEGLNSVALRVEGMPEGANFTLGDIFKRFRRLLKTDLPGLKVLDDEAAASGLFRIAFPEPGQAGDVAFETLVYKVSPDTGEMDLTPTWQEKVPYDKTMRKFFFFSEVIDEKVGSFIERYKLEESKKKALVIDRKKPELTRDRLRLLVPPE